MNVSSGLPLTTSSTKPSATASSLPFEPVGEPSGDIVLTFGAALQAVLQAAAVVPTLAVGNLADTPVGTTSTEQPAGNNTQLTTLPNLPTTVASLLPLLGQQQGQPITPSVSQTAVPLSLPGTATFELPGSALPQPMTPTTSTTTVATPQLLPVTSGAVAVSDAVPVATGEVLPTPGTVVPQQSNRSGEVGQTLEQSSVVPQQLPPLPSPAAKATLEVTSAADELQITRHFSTFRTPKATPEVTSAAEPNRSAPTVPTPLPTFEVRSAGQPSSLTLTRLMATIAAQAEMNRQAAALPVSGTAVATVNDSGSQALTSAEVPLTATLMNQPTAQESAPSAPTFQPVPPRVMVPLPEQLSGPIFAQARLVERGQTKEFIVDLNPPELGSVRVHLSASNEGLTARLVVADQATRALVEGQLNDLRQRLAEQSVQFQHFEVSYSGAEQQSKQQNPNSQAWNQDSAAHSPADDSAASWWLEFARLNRLDVTV